MADTRTTREPKGSASPRRTNPTQLTRAGVVAAVYGGLTIITLQLGSYLAWGPIQFRISEALTVLPLFWSASVPGLALGTLIANLYNLGVAGPLGWLDVVFGTLATLLGALWTRKFRARPALALAGPVLANALIVAAYLPILLAGLGLYQIPFTSIDLESNYLTMYAFGVVTVTIGQAVVVYGLGLPLVSALRRAHIPSDDLEGNPAPAPENPSSASNSK